MAAYSLEEFETFVAEALADLPRDFQDHLDNIQIEVREWPNRRELIQAGLRPGQTLLGLYHGIPLTHRGQGYNLVLPDRITLYRGPILQSARTPEAICEQIRHVVLHEIAHHFGISDQRLRELGAY
jgi:predicted Zn-dependent protease with MMP-like domain